MHTPSMKPVIPMPDSSATPPPPIWAPIISGLSDDAKAMLVGEPEPPEPVEKFACAICKVVGQEEYPDASSYTNEDGEILPYAQLAPNGSWVCSRRCLSQLMFETADERMKEQLKRYERAIAEIADSSSELQDMLIAWDCSSRINLRAIDDARTALGFAGGRRYGKRPESAPWIQVNVDPTEILDAAMRKALWDLNWKVAEPLRGEIEFIHRILERMPSMPLNCTSDISTDRMARTAGSLGSIVSALHSALAGKAAE